MENKNELTIERVFNNTSDLIWNAWTDPEMIKQWWGPNNVTIPECEVDLRVGGIFHIVMEAGEAMGSYKGTRWPMMAEYTIVRPNSKLSYNAKAWVEGQNEDTTIDQTTDLTLIEDDGKTKLMIKAVIHKAGPKAEMAIKGMEAGFTQELEKLKKFLALKIQ